MISVFVSVHGVLRGVRAKDESVVGVVFEAVFRTEGDVEGLVPEAEADLLADVLEGARCLQSKNPVRKRTSKSQTSCTTDFWK